MPPLFEDGFHSPQTAARVNWGVLFVNWLQQPVLPGGSGLGAAEAILAGLAQAFFHDARSSQRVFVAVGVASHFKAAPSPLNCRWTQCANRKPIMILGIYAISCQSLNRNVVLEPTWILDLGPHKKDIKLRFLWLSL